MELWQWICLFSMVSINTIVNVYRLWDYKRGKRNAVQAK